MAAETSTEQPPKGPRNLAQMFHYHYSNTLDAENAKLPQWNKVTTTNDWLSKDNRMKQIKVITAITWFCQFCPINERGSIYKVSRFSPLFI